MTIGTTARTASNTWMRRRLKRWASSARNIEAFSCQCDEHVLQRRPLDTEPRYAHARVHEPGAQLVDGHRLRELGGDRPVGRKRDEATVAQDVDAEIHVVCLDAHAGGRGPPQLRE